MLKRRLARLERSSKDGQASEHTLTAEFVQGVRDEIQSTLDTFGFGHVLEECVETAAGDRIQFWIRLRCATVDCPELYKRLCVILQAWVNEQERHGVS
jgi:hypothetical protein